MGGCDVSGNIPHISICRAVEAGIVPPLDPAAFWRWTAQTDRVLETAREWFEPLIEWAEEGPVGDSHVPAWGPTDRSERGSATPRRRLASANHTHPLTSSTIPMPVMDSGSRATKPAKLNARARGSDSTC